MLVDITPIAKIDWESKGARAYSVPFTSDGYWARSRLPLFVASSGKPGKTIVAIGAPAATNTKAQSRSRI